MIIGDFHLSVLTNQLKNACLVLLYDRHRSRLSSKQPWHSSDLWAWPHGRISTTTLAGDFKFPGAVVQKLIIALTQK